MAYMRVAERKRVTQEECSRIATAFGVQSYTTLWENRHLSCKAKIDQFKMCWTVEPQPLRFTCIMFTHEREYSEVYWNNGYRGYWTNPEFVPLLITGLARMGFSEWSIFDYHLNLLAETEKTKVLLSIPQEYLPVPWQEYLKVEAV